MKHIFSGELKLKDDLDSMDYYIYNSKKVTSNNITNILDYIYEKSKPIYLSIKYKDSIAETHKIFKVGFLNKNLDKYGVLSYFIQTELENYPLELELFELVGQEVEIVIEDNLKTEDWEAYDARQAS